MAVANINEFISSFKTELSRPCNFEVEIIPPTKLSGAFGGGSIAKFRCEQAELPARAFVLIDQKTYGPIEHYPVQSTFNKSAMTFICGDDMKEKTFFDAWMEIISGKQHNGVKFDFEYKVNYCTDIKITQMSLDGKESYTVYLVDAFPAEVYSIPLSWAQVNDYNRLNVVIAYRYFKVFPAGSASGELSQEQQRQTLVDTLSKKAKDNAALKPPVLPPPKPPKGDEGTKNPNDQPDYGGPVAPPPIGDTKPPIYGPNDQGPIPQDRWENREKPPVISVPFPPVAPPDKPAEVSDGYIKPLPVEKPPEISDDSGFRPIDVPPTKPPEIKPPPGYILLDTLVSFTYNGKTKSKSVESEIKLPGVYNEIMDALKNNTKVPELPVAPPESVIKDQKLMEVKYSLSYTNAEGQTKNVEFSDWIKTPPEVTQALKDLEYELKTGKPPTPPPTKPPEVSDPFPPIVEKPPEKPPEVSDPLPPVAPPTKPPVLPPVTEPPLPPVDPKPPEIKPPATQILNTNVTFTYNGVSKSKTVQSEIKTPALTYQIMDALKNNTKIPEIPPPPSKAVIQKENLMEVKYTLSYTNAEGQTKNVEYSDWIKTPPEVTQAFKDLEAELKAQNPPPPPTIGINPIFGQPLY